MSTQVLYLGDTTQDAAAAYLSAVMHFHDITFDYRDSETDFSDELLQNRYAVFVISDYPASRFSETQMQGLVTAVREQGAGLLMIGGWETFTGLGGDYRETPLADLLPVEMRDSDDRVNSYTPCMLQPLQAHPIIDGLPFHEHAAAINGFNKVEVKSGAEMLLAVRRYDARYQKSDFSFIERGVHPLLVVKQQDAGRVACYMGDVAPHWAGGFVDWGDERHAVQAPGANEVEIGNWYMQFFANIINWLQKT